MRRLLLLLTAALLVRVSVPAHAQSQNLAFELFRGYLESLRVQAGIPGMAAAIVGQDRVLWEQAYGRQDLARAVAARTDTPFHLDGLTQLYTATLVLQCVEERRLSLDDRVGQFNPESPEPNATIRQLLTHTSGAPEAPTFAYRPERLEPLRVAVRSCTEDSYRETLGRLLAQLAMVDSVPGPDVIHLAPPAEGVPEESDAERYAGALRRIATPYSIDPRGRATSSQYSVSTLSPSSGLISTVRDFANFDLALRQGFLLEPETLAAAWRTPEGSGGLPLPHGLGWFVQSYKGESVVWQFGLSPDASSSLAITLPARGLTLILLANSDRLVKPFSLAEGEITVSPFARMFLSLFVR